MYDDWPDPPPERWRDDETEPTRRAEVGGLAPPRPAFERGDRLTHLVLVDGRLVDAWTEPVELTPWAGVAEALDRPRRPAPDPAPPPPPRHAQVLAWLDDLVGGREALLALTPEAPAPGEAPLGVPSGVLERRAVVRDLVSAVAERCFDADVEAALHRVVDHLCTDDPLLLTGSRTAAQVAGGVCWVVGRANGLFVPGATQAVVRELLGLRGQLSSTGQVVQRSLGPRWPWRHHHVGVGSDLLATGWAGVLTTSTRRQLVRARDRALAEAAGDAA
ncbi:hypothetical protein INN71_11580 [Nocardioides sp. ChNu-153]|uniref:hypothetical protein n=1 Tax=unclassified Nocardioides TaxID=2615069 RepID=UPI0024069646|nr:MULTISPECIES: hypothetical protein [unclassified Nocardioides]MDF9716225.1 hypothetical protein [Nocardioides sp. ChNu-99]MDN7122033.1 hypothetical protein [Nocardioides sp. ChNu-153]